MKKGDWVIIILVIGLSLALVSMNYINNRSDDYNLKAIIYYNGQVYEEVSLNEEREIEIVTDIGRGLVKVHDHGIEMIESDCKDEICVHTKMAKKNGDMIVCLPNKIVIEVVGQQEVEIDAISG